MGVFDYKDLSGKKCQYGSCQKNAWTLVTYRSFNDEDAEWSEKRFCHKHYHQKFIGNWPNHPEKMYKVDAFKSYTDYNNKEKNI